MNIGCPSIESSQCLSVVLNPQIFGFNTPFSDNEYVSVSKAGVFYAICSDCDNKIFGIYESEKALLEKDPRDLLDAIALKTYINGNIKNIFAIEDTVIIDKETNSRISIASFEDRRWKKEMPSILSEQYSMEQLRM